MKPRVTSRLPRALWLLLSVMPADAAAQETTGDVRGRAIDVADGPLAGVAVTLSGPGLVAERAIPTDSRGRFRFLRVPVGEYQARLERIGLRTVVQVGIRVRLGSTTDLGDITLQTQAVGVAPLVVSAPRLMVDPMSTTVGSQLHKEQFERLPTSRDYASILELMPQSNASGYGDAVNIGGATGWENSYHIDGVNVTDAHRAFGGTRLPYNFIEAIELREGGYQAEFGGALGGLANVVTRSGSDRLEVGGYGFFTNDALGASPRALPGAVPSEGSNEYDIGVHVGGPVVPGRLRFFAAYNPSFEHQNIAVERFGLHTAEIDRHMFAGKLDWDPGSGSSLSLSVFGDPTTQQIVNPNVPGLGGVAAFETIDPALGTRKTGGVNFALTGKTSLGARTLLEATLAHHNRRESEFGATPAGRSEPLRADLNTDPITLGGGWLNDLESTASRTTARMSGTVFLGAHTAKAGFEYQENTLDIVYNNKGWILQFGDEFQVDVQHKDFDLANRIPALYIQDTWRISPRVTLNAGLRWDSQYLTGSDGPVAQRFTDQLQPRLGVVFQPGETGTQKIFGSFARYYLQMPLFMSSNVYAKWEENRGLSYGPFDPRLFPDSIQAEEERTDPCCYALDQVDGASADHSDEFVLGYERTFGDGYLLRASVVRRVLRNTFQFLYDPSTESWFAGNPGEGDLSHLERMKRNYTALELTGMWEGERGAARLSYVLSRNSGDYSGAMAQEVAVDQQEGPNNNFTLQLPAQLVNNDGLLPNDRTHALKLSAAYSILDGLTAGTFFTAQSGTPLNEFGVINLLGVLTSPIFLQPRGTAGRTPALWDLNLRFTCDLPIPGRLKESRVIMDLMHVGNPQAVMHFDQFRYRSNSAPLGASYQEQVAGQNIPNSNYGEPLAFQAPFVFRMGLEFRF